MGGGELRTRERSGLNGACLDLDVETSLSGWGEARACPLLLAYNTIEDKL